MMPEDKNINEYTDINLKDSDNLSENLSTDIINEIKENTTLTKLLSQDLIVVSSDRLRLVYLQYIKEASNRQAWLAPAGIFISLLLSLLTSNFKKFLGVEGLAWQGFFMLAALISFCWFIYKVQQAFKAKDINDVTGFIEAIKEYEKELTNRST